MPFPQELTKKWGKEVGWKCMSCGKRWVDGWKLESHHKIPSHNGGQNVRENWILLCQECHMKAHELLARNDHNSANIIRSRLKNGGGRWKP